MASPIVTVGTGLTYLGTGAFFDCPNLLSVFFRGNAPTPAEFHPNWIRVGRRVPRVHFLRLFAKWGLVKLILPVVVVDHTLVSVIQRNKDFKSIRAKPWLGASAPTAR